MRARLCIGFSLAIAIACACPSARAAGPLILGVDGVPLRWQVNPIPFNPDKGQLGRLNNAAAVAAVTSAFDVWAAVPTANVSFTNGGSLPEDVTRTNGGRYLFGPCGDGLSPIIFDTDGQITDALFGLGARNSILGFASPSCVSFDPPVITTGIAVMNGRFIDGLENDTNAEVPLTDFQAVFIHEFGHFLNLAHSQIGLSEAFDDDPGNDGAIATMFPFLVNGAEASTLTLDDEVGLSMLYPGPSFGSARGTISGLVLLPDGTPFGDAYVIARRVGDPRTSAVGVPSAPGFNQYGPPAAAIGHYELPGLPPGDYTVEIEAIDGRFKGGSSVGPRDPPAPFPGPPEFWNGASEAGADPPDDPTEAVPIPVVAGATVSGVDVIINAFPSNDFCETATVIPSLPFSDTTDTTAATTSNDDPNVQCASYPVKESNSVWYRFTATADEFVVADTYDSEYRTRVGVYTGTCGGLAEVGCDRAHPAAYKYSQAVFPVTTGTTYWIEVTQIPFPVGFATCWTRQCGGTLRLNVVPLPAATNDECTAPTVITSLPFHDLLDATTATHAPSDPVQACGSSDYPTNSNSVWYSFTSPATQIVTASSAVGTESFPVLSVHAGSCGALAEQACTLGEASPLTFEAARDTTYLIEVSNYGTPTAADLRALRFSFDAACPAKPLAGCKRPIAPKQSRIVLADALNDDRDVLDWRWSRGAETTAEEFGDPGYFTGYTLCVYDESGGKPQVAWSARLPMFTRDDCFTDRACSFRFTVRLPDGRLALKLAPGEDGSVGIRFKARGRLIAASPLPLAQDATVTAQLINSDGYCWEASYTGHTKNTGARFDARAD